MGKNQRREFLKKSMLGLIPSAFKLNVSIDPGQNEVPVLPYRILGKTGIKTPLISLGAGNVNDSSFIKASYHAGVKLFFSATYYGEGNNERLAGEGLKGLPRDTFAAGTAVTPDGFDTNKGKFTSPLDVDAYIKKAEESIKRFGLEYLDFLLFPYAGKKDVMLNSSLLKALGQLKKAGKAKFVGIATHDNCAEALRAAADSKFYDVVMTAYNFKTDDKDEINGAITYAAKAGVGVVAMKTLAGVYEDKRRNKPVDSDIALKWVLQNENISSVVSGMSSLEELTKNLAMIKNIILSGQELKELGFAGSNRQNSLYCQQCGTCIPQCSNNLAIPSIMRSYMYAYGYKNMEYAQHTLLTTGISGNPCSGCDACNIKCRSGFDIKERVQDISRLRDVPREFLKA
jgi:predicted aldo/keto reductase-like oxidoreductase